MDRTPEFDRRSAVDTGSHRDGPSAATTEQIDALGEREPQDAGAGVQRSTSRRPLDLSVARFSGVYLIIAFCIIYSLWEPNSFFTVTNLRVTLADQAITGILTMGLIVSLISGAFDLSIAATMSWSITFVAWLQSSGHVPWVAAVAIVLASGTLIGTVNALIVTRLRVDSVIATLGMSSVIEALTYWLVGGQSIVGGLSKTFVRAGEATLLGVPLPFYYFLVVSVALWYVLGHTPIGRYLYAVGGNRGAARLAGLRVDRIQWIGLMTSATIASLAGVVFTAQLGTGSFDAGSPYLLSAFAGAFLGATQIKPGRFNVVGTLVAIYLVGVGVKGLQLRFPADPWIQDLFEGVVLIVAVGLAVRSARRRRSR